MVAAAQAIDVDIPLDPATQQSFLVKTASVASIGVGEFLSYNLRLRNPGLAAAPLGLNLVDVLPIGFRYQSGSARLQAAPPPSLVVRSEQSMLAQVIALAHTAGVHDVQVAYEPASRGRP